MAKQTTTPARDAFQNIVGKIPELQSQRRNLVQQIVKIERVSPQGIASGVASPPPGGSVDIEAPAYAMLNGSAVSPMPSRAGDESVKLYGLQRELKIVDRAIQIARNQASTASVAASREVVSENLDQINDLHKQRAL